MRPDHPEVLEVVASNHCVQRFRRRMKITAPGLDAVAERLADVLQDADFSRWPPSWVLSDRDTELWALLDDIAFPLSATPYPGRWVATTCLVRGMAR
jgi:hypothetical protein